MQWNVGRMRNIVRFDEIITFINNFKYKVHLIVIGTTWIQGHDIDLYHLNSYKVVFFVEKTKEVEVEQFL